MPSRRVLPDGRRRRWRRSRQGVQPIIATILLVGVTVALVGVIYLLIKPPPLGQPTQLDYVIQSGVTEQTWGDPTDCTNTGLNAVCDTIPASFIIFTGHIPQYLQVSKLKVIIWCNGTQLLNGTFQSIEIVPGSGANPNASSPKLGHCGSWYPPSTGNQATFFNRLAYFQQLQHGFVYLEGGDQIVVYAHPPSDFTDRSGHGPDDDFHGAPLWCYNVPNACSVEVIDTGAGGGVSLATISLYGLGPH